MNRNGCSIQRPEPKYHHQKSALEAIRALYATKHREHEEILIMEGADSSSTFSQENMEDRDADMTEIVIPGLPTEPAHDMPQLRQRLLTNAHFRCGKSTFGNAANQSRVYFRGVAHLAPQDAGFNTVHIQRYLAPKSVDHSTPCATNTFDRDPARRLGIKLTYRLRALGIERSM